MSEQLALELGPSWVVTVVESTPGRCEYTSAPQSRERALMLAMLLLNRSEPPPGDGPWRLARPGGTRVVRMIPAG